MLIGKFPCRVPEVNLERREWTVRRVLRGSQVREVVLALMVPRVTWYVASNPGSLFDFYAVLTGILEKQPHHFTLF